jgi:hypothetical protein
MPTRKPRTVVVVPVNSVSRLTARALSEARSIGDEVLAVTVVFDGEDDGAPTELERDWGAWRCDVPLHVLRTEYASVVGPIVALIDELRARDDTQVVVLIPVVRPARLRYAILHNHVDAALAGSLRRRSDVIVARVPMALHAVLGHHGPPPGPGDLAPGPPGGTEDHPPDRSGTP